MHDDKIQPCPFCGGIARCVGRKLCLRLEIHHKGTCFLVGAFGADPHSVYSDVQYYGNVDKWNHRVRHLVKMSTIAQRPQSARQTTNKKMTDEESIKNKYPTSCCVGTSCFRGYEFRIWPTSSFFETSYLGYGITEEDAWKDAVKKQQNTQSGLRCAKLAKEK